MLPRAPTSVASLNDPLFHHRHRRALCFSSAAGAEVHMRALFAGVLLSFAVVTLLVFWDA